MTTVRELRELLLEMDQDSIVTVWDPLLDAECHLQVPIESSGPFTVLIESNAKYVTEEDVS